MAVLPLKIDYSDGTPRVRDKNIEGSKNLPLSRTGADYDDLNEDIDRSLLRTIHNRMPRDMEFQTLTDNYTAVEADRSKMFFGVVDAKVLTLPEDPPVGWRCGFGCGNLGITVAVETQGTNRFVLPDTDPISVAPDHLESSVYASYCWFMFAGDGGLGGIWFMFDGNGFWQDDAGTPNTYNFDGHVSGGTDGNFVSRDGSGTIGDSGSKAADFEPAIGAKGDAFNKNFGTGSGEVCEGNDSRLSDARNLTVITATTEPTLADGQTVIWIDSDTGPNDTYLVHRRAVDSVQVKVQLA